MANMEIVPLFGSSFSVYAPIITAIVGFITFFNIYARLLKFIGIQDEDSVTVGEFCGKISDSDKEEIETGKRLVAGQIRQLNNILLAESRAAATNKDTISLLVPGSPNTNALGADDDGDVELAGDDDESPKQNDLTGWGQESPSTSSFYSSFKSGKKEEPIQETVPKKEETYLFGSWRSKESTKPEPAVKKVEKLDDSSSSKEYKSSSNSRSNHSVQESKLTSPSSLAQPPAPSNSDSWGGTGSGWDLPATSRKGGRYG